MLLSILQGLLNVNVNVHFHCVSASFLLVKPYYEQDYEENRDVVGYEIAPDATLLFRFLNEDCSVVSRYFIPFVICFGSNVVEENEIILSHEYLSKDVVCVVRLVF